MAEYNDGSVDMSYGEGIGLGGVNSDEEYETMTAAEVLEKLEEVWSLHKWDDTQWIKSKTYSNHYTFDFVSLISDTEG